MKNAFSFSRFAQLVRRDWAMSRKSWFKMAIITTAITTTILTVILNLNYLSGEFDSAHASAMFTAMTTGSFMGILLIGGSISSATAFEDLHSSGRGISWLMLPATRLEKWASAFLFSLVVYGFVAIASYLMAVFLSASGFNALRSAQISSEAIWGFLRPANFLKNMAAFAAAHAIYFLGSIWFRKNHWMNTTLWVIAIAVAAGLAIDWLPRLLLAGQHVDLSQAGEKWFASIDGQGDFALPMSIFWTKAAQILTVAAVPFLWFLSFLKLGEKEI